MHGNLPRKASNSDIRRWLENGSVLINGVKPKPRDIINFPLEQLIFFPNNPKKRCTQFDDYEDERSPFYEMKVKQKCAITKKILSILSDEGYSSYHIETFQHKFNLTKNGEWFVNVVAQLNLDGRVEIHEYEFKLEEVSTI